MHSNDTLFLLVLAANWRHTMKLLSQHFCKLIRSTAALAWTDRLLSKPSVE